jgi:general secretion pathway protein G
MSHWANVVLTQATGLQTYEKVISGRQHRRPRTKEETVQHSLERLRQRRVEGAGEGGFTLIELLIVIVILGILAAIVVFAVQNLSSTSAQASCKSDFKTVETAVEAYKAQTGNYPSGSAATAAPTPNTDDEAGTAPLASVTLNTNGGTAVAATAINAAGASTGSGDELLVQGDTAHNNVTAAASTGPWLKDVPSNSGHYTIFAANDGTGHILVLDSKSKVVGAGGEGNSTTSVTVTYSPADCGGIS